MYLSVLTGKTVPQPNGLDELANEECTQSISSLQTFDRIVLSELCAFHSQILEKPLRNHSFRLSRFRKLERIQRKSEHSRNHGAAPCFPHQDIDLFERPFRVMVPAYLTLLIWSITSTVSINGPVMPLTVSNSNMACSF
jgi:hypothetical protein